MYIAIGYYNTGFDIINVPDSPTLLRNSAGNTHSFPALDILNKQFLPSIKVKLNPSYDDSQLDGLEYIELKEENAAGNGIFYYVTSYSLTSRDVAVLNLVQDSLLTAGGASILGSVYAKRCHVPVAEDKFGAYDADDEMIMPKEPLQLVHSGERKEFKDSSNLSLGYNDGKSGLFFSFMDSGEWSSGGGQQTVIVSTAGLYHSTNVPISYSSMGGYFGNSVTGGDPSDGMRFPQIKPARGVTVEMPILNRYVDSLSPYFDTQLNKDRLIEYRGVEYNRLADSSGLYGDTIEAVDVLRAIGMEDSIISCYRLRKGEGYLTNENSSLPNKLIGQSYMFSTNGWTSSGAWTGEQPGSSSRIMSGSEAYDYDYVPKDSSSDYTIKNTRVLYGEFRKYVLSSPATGSTIEAKPEELTARHFIFDYDNRGINGAPYVCCFTDPRPTGRPYFNFMKFGMEAKYYTPVTGNTNKPIMNLAEGAIAGGQWPEVPIVFTGMAGEWTAKVGYNIDASYKNYLASPDKTYRDLVSGSMMSMDQSSSLAASQGVYNMVSGSLSSGVSGLMFGGPAGAASGLAGGAISGGVGIASQMASAQNTYNASLEAANMDRLYGMSSDLVSAANAGSVSANRALERQYAAAYEKSKFDLSTAYSVPRAKFMATDSMRDMTNNAVFYARYTPCKADMARMDNILSAFGYKVDQIMNNPAANRSKFVYIEGSVEKFNQNNFSPAARSGKRELMLDINNQLANGIRIWHINPTNANIYDPGV